MLNLHKSKLIRSLNSRFLLLAIMVLIVLAGTVVTMPGHSKASGGPAQARSGSITASPNPIPVTDGSGLGVTTISWSFTGTSVVEVHVGSPTGPLFARAAWNGSWSTGKWVHNGMVFYLQDVSRGFPLTMENTLATATVYLTECGPNLSRATQGEFCHVTHLPLVPVHLSVLPDGRVLFWGRDKNIATDGSVKEVGGKSEAYVWNIADGSNKTDVAVFRPSEGKWYIVNSSTGAVRIKQWGINGDVPVPRDYDGDGRTDIAVFRPSDGNWWIIDSSTGVVRITQWGISGDVSVPGDYDGDGRADIAVFRPSDGNWWIINSSSPVVVIPWGQNGDVPVPGDYDRDRKTDIAVFRPSEGNWYIRQSSDSSFRLKQWGQNGDVPAQGDYNGDGTMDLAVFRPSNGNWYIRNIANDSNQTIAWGQSTDIVAQGDYDGDGRVDPCVYRPSEGRWYIRNISDGKTRTMTWGQNGDVPVPKDYDGMFRVANSTTNLFCSGHSFLPDGRLLVAGGHKSPDFDGAGERHINIFDYGANRWSRGPDMNLGRWYPYNVTLGTGETLIVSGAYWSNEPTQPALTSMNPVPQVYTREGVLRDLDSRTSLTTYPYLHLAPNGKVFQAQSGFFPLTCLHLDCYIVDKGSKLLNPYANQGCQWEDLAGGSTRFPHANGTSVLFDSGSKVLLAGGFGDRMIPNKDAEYIDLMPAMGQPTWTQTAQMNFARAFHTATILPDGKVMVTGGVSCQGGNNIESDDRTCDNGQVLIPEMWDPVSGQWSLMAPHKEVRAYHSVAALLPDGRVLVGGGGLPGAVGETDANGFKIGGMGYYDSNNNGRDDGINEPHARLFGHKNVEIYSPPYLFDSNGNPAVRPVITSVPLTISYGQTFLVETSGAGSNPLVSLVRLASVTHGFNQDQRQIFLATAVNASGIIVNAPADPNKCPPGYYMLFVLRRDGAGSKYVPSVAEIIRVQEPASSSILSATMTCDNSYDVYFNGSYKGSGSTWWQSQTYSLPVQTGKNVLAIRCSDAGGVAGFLAELRINGYRIGSGKCWKMSRNAPANWTDVNFDDSGWVDVTEYGSYGISPWFTSVNGMPADTPGRWIWSSNNDLDDVIYIRVSFIR